MVYLEMGLARTMKGLRAAESHSADRAAKLRLQFNKAIALLSPVELFNNCDNCNGVDPLVVDKCFTLVVWPGRPSGFLWRGVPS